MTSFLALETWPPVSKSCLMLLEKPNCLCSNGSVFVANGTAKSPHKIRHSSSCLEPSFQKKKLQLFLRDAKSSFMVWQLELDTPIDILRDPNYPLLRRIFLRSR